MQIVEQLFFLYNSGIALFFVLDLRAVKLYIFLYDDLSHLWGGVGESGNLVSYRLKVKNLKGAPYAWIPSQISNLKPSSLN